MAGPFAPVRGAPPSPLASGPERGVASWPGLDAGGERRGEVWDGDGAMAASAESSAGAGAPGPPAPTGKGRDEGSEIEGGKARRNAGLKAGDRSGGASFGSLAEQERERGGFRQELLAVMLS